MSFGRKQEVKKHTINVHQIQEQQNNFNCSICEKSFATSKFLKHHIKGVHEGHKDCKCEYCGKSFSQARNLKKHIQTIHNSKKKNHLLSEDSFQFQ